MAWREKSAPIYAAITEALQAGDWVKARLLVSDLDMTEVGTENQQYIRYLLLSCAMFGSGMAHRDSPAFLDSGAHNPILDKATSNILQYLERAATQAMQTRALQLIADHQAQKRDGWKYGNTQVDIPAGSDAATRIEVLRAQVTDEHLAGDGKDIGANHVTVRYGIKPGADVAGIREYIAQLKPFTAKLGKATIFPASESSDGASPVVLAVEAPELHAINEEMGNRGEFIDPTFDYKPHATVAYVDPKHSHHYAGLDGGGATFPVNSITISSADGTVEEIPFAAIPVKKAAGVLDAPPQRYVKPLVSFDEQGDPQLQLIASQNSSRIATWGFTSEAEVRGMTRYRLQATLDGRTSEFCQMINGREFNVSAARAKVLEVLNAPSPEDAKTLQPWPRQDKASIEAYSKMSNEDLVALGLLIPPYHPACRTLCTDISHEGGTGAQGGAEDSGGDLDDDGDQPAPDQPLPPMLSTGDTFNELGIDAMQDEVDHWNAFMGINPVDVFQKLTGATGQTLLDGGWQTAIQFLDDGSISMNAAGAVNDVTAQVGTTLDPVTGTYYLDQADFKAGNSGAENDFLSQLLSGMVDVGTSVNASSLVVAVDTDAANYIKLGFLPSPAVWDQARLAAIKDINEAGSLFPLYRSLDVDQRQLLMDALNSSDENTANMLAHLPWSFGGETVGGWLFSDVVGDFTLDLTNAEKVAAAQEYLDAS